MLSAERPQTRRKRPREDAAGPSTDNLPGSTAAAGNRSDADQPARKLAEANPQPRPASAQSYEEGQLPPEDDDEDVPVPARPHIPTQAFQTPIPTAEYAGAPAAVDRNVQERMAAVLGIKTPAESVALREAAEPNMADRLNPNNAAYDPQFAAHHRAMRAQTNPKYEQQKARKQMVKQIKRLHWPRNSHFTAEEHGYMLDLQGEFVSQRVSVLFVSGSHCCLITIINSCLLPHVFVSSLPQRHCVCNLVPGSWCSLKTTAEAMYICMCCMWSM